MQEELRQSLKSKSEIVEENNRLKKELDKTISMMEETAHKYSMEQSNSQMTLMKQKTESERVEQDLKNKISAFQSEKKNLEELIAELRDKNSVLEKEYLDKLRLSKEDGWSKLAQAEAEKGNLEKTVVSLKHTNSELQSKSDAMLHENEKEISRIKKELQEFHMTVESLQDTNKSLLLEKDHYSSNLEELKREIHTAEIKNQDYFQTCQQLKTQLQAASEKISVQEASVNSLELQIVELNQQSAKEMEAYDHTLERQNMKYNQDKQNLNQQIEVITRDRLQCVERIEMLESVMERQQTLFESKINMLKDRVKACKTETSSVKSLLEQENVKTEQRREDIRKKQAGLLQFLSSVRPATVA